MHACGVATHLTFNFFTIVRNYLKPFWNIRAANAQVQMHFWMWNNHLPSGISRPFSFMSNCTAFCPLLPCTREIHVVLIGSSNTGISQEMCDLQRDVLIYECMICHSIGIFYAHYLWCPVGLLYLLTWWIKKKMTDLRLETRKLHVKTKHELFTYHVYMAVNLWN